MRPLAAVTLLCYHLLAVLPAHAQEDAQAIIQADPRIDLPPQTDVVRPFSTDAVKKIQIAGTDKLQVCQEAAVLVGKASGEAKEFWQIVDAHCKGSFAVLDIADRVAEVDALSAAVTAAGPDVVARFAAGFAQFVFTRAQTEVVMYVTTDFGVRLCTRSFNGFDVKSFFPDSCTVLTGQGSVSPNDIDVQQLGAALQAALQSDLIRLIPVVINSATDLKIPPHVAALIQAVTMIAPAGGAPPTADAILDALASVSIACNVGTASEKQACEAFRRTIAIIKALRAAEATCMTPAACVTATLTILGQSSDEDRRVVEQIVAFAADVRRTYSSGSRVDNLFTRVSLLRRAWQLVVETSIAEDDRGPHLELLRRFDQQFFRWHEVGLMIYRTVEALRRQRGPVEVLVAATQQLQCTGVGDVRCGLMLVGIAGQAIAATADANGKIDLAAAKKKFLEYIDGKKDVNLDAWLAAFIKEKTDGTKPITEYVTAVSQPIDNLLRLVRQARALRDDPDLMPDVRRIQLTEIAVQLTDAVLALWQAVLPDTVPSAELQRIASLVRHFNAAWKAADERDFPRLIAALYPLAADLGVREPIPAPLRRYVPLITGIAAAKTSADFTAVLQAYAAPAGSWREKQRQPFSASVNSFLGASAGIVDGRETRELAIFLPLGVDLAWPKFRTFVSLADVGNVAALRSGDLEVPEDVSLDDLIAPGIFVNFPLGRRSPFVWGFSAMYVPFQVPGVDGAPATRERGLRVSVVFAVDVPIMTLYKRGNER